MEKIISVYGIEDGEYIARWEGLEFKVDGKTFITEHSMGVPAMEIKVKVVNGIAYSLGFA